MIHKNREIELTLMEDKKFQIRTILAIKYNVTLKEVYSWFFSWNFFIFVIIAQVFLNTLVPHNAAYDLKTYAERIPFWALLSILYIIGYLVSIYFGAILVRTGKFKYYYTPIGMLLATLLASNVGIVYLAYLHDLPIEYSLYRVMEIIFNMLWASFFEALFFLFGLPKNIETPDGDIHKWENIDK